VKIGTYNILYARYDWEERTRALCGELKRVDLDIVALQEVHETYSHYPTGRMIEYIAKEAGYGFFTWDFPPDRDNTSGIAFLSKFTIDKIEKTWTGEPKERIAGGIRTTIETAGCIFGITNIHVNRNGCVVDAEKQLVHLDRWIGEREAQDAIEILLGDFNFVPESNAHAFLCGKQSLFERDANWIDVGDGFAKRSGKIAEPTVDPVHNPRWNQYERDYINGPMRMDWILIRDNWKIRNTVKINDFQRFGDRPYSKNSSIPSDHYGIFVDLEIVNEPIEYSQMVKEWY
jgi:maltose 6'-phosphate phosphatase